MKTNMYMGAGMWSWFMQRITGLLLVLYLMTHLWNNHFRYIKTPLDPLFQVIFSSGFTLILLVLVVYHGFNGVRSVAIDLGGSLKLQKQIFWSLMFLGLILIYGIGSKAKLF